MYVQLSEAFCACIFLVWSIPFHSCMWLTFIQTSCMKTAWEEFHSIFICILGWLWKSDEKFMVWKCHENPQYEYQQTLWVIHGNSNFHDTCTSSHCFHTNFTVFSLHLWVCPGTLKIHWFLEFLSHEMCVKMIVESIGKPMEFHIHSPGSAGGLCRMCPTECGWWWQPLTPYTKLNRSYANVATCTVTMGKFRIKGRIIGWVNNSSCAT